MNSRQKQNLACGSAIVLMLGFALPMSAAAQAAPAAAKKAEAATDATLEEIVVVGSRIHRDVFNSPSPIQVITREEVTIGGYASTADLLQSSSVTSGSAQINGAYGGFVTNGGPGAKTLALRGLGAGRTLVMINGRRVAPAGTRGSVGSADLNVLPDAMIDHVEILRDGASSIYGSDAIAGVVNVVTRSGLEDTTVEGQYVGTEHGGGGQTRLSVVSGRSGDRWHASGSLEYYEEGRLTLGQRDWTACNTDYYLNKATGQSLDFIDPKTGQPKCYPITATGSNGVTINAIGTNTLAGVGAAGSVGTTFNRWRPNAAITTGLVGFEGVGGGANSLGVRDTFDPKMLNRDILEPNKIYTVFGEGSYDLQSLGNAKIYGEVLYNERKTEETGYRQLTLDYIKGSALIPANLAGSTFQSAPTAITSGKAVGVRAFIGFGNDLAKQDVKFYKATAGIRGDLTFAAGWKYDAYAMYSKSDASYFQQSFLTDRVANSLNVVAAPAGFTGPSSNGLTCAINVTTPTANCIAAPALNTATIAGQLPADYTKYIFVPVVGNTQYTEELVSATADGPVFKLPAGDLKAAVGFEYRQQKIDDEPDPNSVSGNLYNLTSSAVTKGTDHVWEAYAELEAPILRDAPLAKSLTFSLSGRYTDYRSYGSDTTYKVGGLWQITDWISLRATYGTSFRAPALFEQFLGATTGFLSAATDPCNNYGAAGVSAVRAKNCASELPGAPNFQNTSSVTVVGGGGAAQGLSAETSKNFTGGAVFQPKLPENLGRFEAALDYFDIAVDNGVARIGAGNLLPLCYDDPGFRTTGKGFCRYITRSTANGALTVADSYTNVAVFKVKGYDLNLRWRKDIGSGQARFNANVTMFTEQASKQFSDLPLSTYNGQIGAPKWTGSFDFGYKVNNWDLFYGIEWTSKMDSYDAVGVAPSSQYTFDTPDYYIHRAGVTYKAPRDVVITLSVKNLFDKEPPQISSGAYNRVGNAPLYSGLDYLGRRASLTISKKF